MTECPCSSCSMFRGLSVPEHLWSPIQWQANLNIEPPYDERAYLAEVDRIVRARERVSACAWGD